MIKYRSLHVEDFKVHSIEKGYDLDNIWKDVDFKDPNLLPSGRNADGVKVTDQAKRTREAILRLKRSFELSHQLSNFRVK